MTALTPQPPSPNPGRGGLFDLIIIGAGINGTGIARDAALRGLSTLLVDKGDIGGGTTSWSSRLIHGGLRYLEHGEVGLVRESLRERERLLRIAPHLVKPLPLLIPIYDHHRRGPWLIRAGMVAYDLLSFDKSLPRHRMLNRDAALRRVPGLQPAGLRGAALYYDAQVAYPERIAVENALDAQTRGAVVRPYARVDRLLVQDGAVHGVELTSMLDQRGQTIAGRVIVNVAGPWVDDVLTGLNRDGPASDRLIGGTKGSHIAVESFPGAPPDALYVEARQDGRAYFIIPWNGLYLIGTTDRRYDGNLDRVVPDDSEIAYLLREANVIIPGGNLGRDDICYAYAGVRPLPYEPDGREAGITRRHIVHDHAPAVEGLLSVVGGKLTTHRNLAEQVVDAVYRKLGRPSPPCRTAALPLPGAGEAFAGFADAFGASAPSWLTERCRAHLLAVYGSRASDVLALAVDDPVLREVISPATGGLAAEIVFAFRHELAHTLTDALLRRTMIGYGAAAGLPAAEPAARICRHHLGWEESRARAEVADYRAHMKRYKARRSGDKGVAPGGTNLDKGVPLGEANINRD